MDFRAFNLNPSLQRAIDGLNYTTPTPIQEQAIPVVLSGKDVVGLAQTGTGKTAAYVLPMLELLLAKNATRPRALILSPTRELAEQINQVVRGLGKNTQLRSTTIYGGVSMRSQIQAIKSRLDIIVACPGRLLDHLRQRTLDLRSIELLVLDEADQMFDMGFLPDVKKIVDMLSKERQTLLFSATMPDEIRRLADSILKNPETIKIGHAQPAETISHSVVGVHTEKKTSLLLQLLKTTCQENVLVFTKTKHKAKSVAKSVSQAGFDATSLQGNLSQAQRQRALDGFKKGRYQILVATDIAARGIDVSNISHVINFDVPSTPEAYTHRIGRTGRASRTGEAVTFICKDDIRMLRAIEKTIGNKIDRKDVEGFESAAIFAAEPSRSNDRGDRKPYNQRRRHSSGGGRRYGGGGGQNRRYSGGQERSQRADSVN